MTLSLAVQTFPGANHVLARHWPYFLRSGADEYFVITTTDGKCTVPQGAREMPIGVDMYCIGAHLPRRLLGTLEFMLTQTKTEFVGVCEYDVIFFKNIPKLREGLTTHLAGGKLPGAHCNRFYHSPWLMDRKTAMTVIKFGHELLATGQFDPSPDLFLGHVAELSGIDVDTDRLKSYSQNTIHGPVWINEARQARLDGAVCCHGVKSTEVLEKILV